MQLRSIASFFPLIFALSLSIASPSSAQEDRRSSGLLDRLPGEDPSCDFVNRSYERAHSKGISRRGHVQ